MKSKKHAFTLAEVLITLGIIGVVAAMTIPTLINNYQKNVTLTRLKHTYSTIIQALALAEVDYGPMDNWGMERYAGPTGPGKDARVARDTFVNNYMLPYLANAFRYEKKPMSQIGYTNGIKYPNGNVAIAATREEEPIRLKNGVIIFPKIWSYHDERIDEDINVAILFLIDINGTTGENTFGKDIFMLEKLFINGIDIIFYDERPLDEYIYDENEFTEKNLSRDELLEKCKKGDAETRSCGALIKRDGWKISDDYPWF